MNKRHLTVRNRKRQLIQVAIMLATPVVACPLTSDLCFADSPSETSQRLLPPLPVSHASATAAESPSAPTSQPQVNPFCEPAPLDGNGSQMSMSPANSTVARQSRVQLASGADEPVDNEPLEPLVQPVQVAPKRNKWVPPVDTTIQAKPIEANRGSMNFAGALEQAKETPVVDGAVSFNPAAPPVASKKSAATKPAASGSTAGAVAPVKPNQFAQDLPELPPLPAPVHVDVKHKPAGVNAPATSTATTAKKSDGAVSFSLNDDTLVETSVEAVKPHQTASKADAANKPSFAPLLSHGESQPVPPVVVSKSKSIPVLPASVPLPASQTAKSQATASKPIKANQFAGTDEVVIDRGSSKQRTHLVPLTEPEAIRPVAVSTVPDRRIVRGGRPAVDVGVPPVMIERATASSVPLVEAVSDLNPANAPKRVLDKAFESDQVVVLDLKSTEVRALKLDHAISKVQVGDSQVCAALAAGPQQVQLIGARDGITRLAVWTNSPTGQETRVCMRSVWDRPTTPMPVRRRVSPAS